MCNIVRFVYSGRVVKRQPHKNNNAKFQCNTCNFDLREKLEKGSRDEVLNFLLNLTSCGYETAGFVRRYTEKKVQSMNKETSPQVKDEDRPGAIQDAGGLTMENQEILERGNDISTLLTPSGISDKINVQGGIDLLEKQESIICVKASDRHSSQRVSADDNLSMGPTRRRKLALQSSDPNKVTGIISTTSRASVRKKQSIEGESDAIFAARLQASYYRENRPQRSRR